MRRLTLLLLVAPLLSATNASAHSYADPALRTVFDGVQPSVLPAAVTVSVVPSVVDQLVVTNPTSVPLDILAIGGEPFLRISSGGVLANLASPDWYATGTPEGGPVPPMDVQRDKGRGLPRWKLVSHASSWSEFDPRLHPQATATPQMRAAGQERVLAVWRIPLAYGTQRFAATGHVLFAPIRGGLSVTVAHAPTGVSATALQGELPGLFVSVQAGEAVEVDGSDGQPFLRFHNGEVYANTTGASWRDDQQARGRAVLPQGWARVARGLTYSWLDPRLRYPHELPTAEILAKPSPSVVQRWRVPVVVDGSGDAVEGTVTWVPRALALEQVGVGQRVNGVTWWPFALGGGFAAAGLAGWLQRRGANARKGDVRHSLSAAGPSGTEELPQ